MRKITLFLMSLFLTVGAMAQFSNENLLNIESGDYYIYHTDANGVRHYLQIAGQNQVTTVTENPKYFTVTKNVLGNYITATSGKYSTWYKLEMNGLLISNTPQDGSLIETKTWNGNDDMNWAVQAIFCNQEGKVAIRLTNAKAENNWHGHWFIGLDANCNPVAVEPGNAEFLWTVEEYVPVRTEYVHKEGNINRPNFNDRRFNSFTITDGVNPLTVTSIQPAFNSPIYADKTSNKLTTTAGATLRFSAFDWIGNAMHAYAYIDYNKDYYFNSTDNNKGESKVEDSEVLGEIVSYNYYNGKDITGTTYDENNRGNRTHDNPSYGDSKGMPAFTLPANLEPGEYRMRIKIDWNNIDADKGASDIASNGGCQCDITIVVEDAEPCNITYNYKEGDKLIASIKHVVNSGAAYPDLISGLYGVTVNSTKPSGNVTADSEHDIDVTIGEMPFEYYDSYAALEAANGWYNLVMHSNWNTGGGTARYRTYLSHNEGGSVLAWGTERSLTNPSDAHYWAFVGNPITGFRVVNKAKGEGYVLSSNGTANPLMLEEETLPEGYNTTWQIAGRRYDVSETGEYIIEGAWFCLKHTNGQYMNANATNGNVAFYSDNDNGSGILAVKPLVIDEAADYATYYSDNYVKMPSTLGAEVYYVNGVENGYAKFESISGEVIPAQTGVVVKYDTESKVVYAPEITSKGTTADITGNLLKGTTKRTLINKDANKAYYALGLTEGIGFYNAVNGNNANEFYNNAFKAYLEIDNTSGAAMSASLRFDFGGTTTIEEVETEAAETVIYDLTGRRVNEITKAGVYIVNGKKVLVK